MSEWHFYSLATGAFTRGRFVSSDAGLVAANTPPGCAAFEGRVDPDSQRIDLMTGALVDWQPERPSVDHEWSADVRRWELTPEAAKREADAIDAQRRIASLELAQLRPLRELLINVDNPVARARLVAIDAEIASERQRIITKKNTPGAA